MMHKHSLGRLSHDGGMVGKVIMLLCCYTLLHLCYQTARSLGFDEYPFPTAKIPLTFGIRGELYLGLIFDAARALRLCTSQYHCSEASFHAEDMAKWKMPSTFAEITIMLPGYLTGQGGQNKGGAMRLCETHPHLRMYSDVPPFLLPLLLPFSFPLRFNFTQLSLSLSRTPPG
jgi:hypothetical protein